MIKRIAPEQLNAQLPQFQHGFYILLGQDVLLLQEAQDSIVQFAKQQGFTDIQSFDIDNSTPWEQLLQACQSMELFSQQQVFIFQLPDNITVSQQKQLAELIANHHHDLLFVFKLPKFNRTQEKQAWFQLLNQPERASLLIQCQTPTIEQLPLWIAQRARQMQLTIDSEAVNLLAYNYEGNLAALKQQLQLLQLLYPDGKLTYSQVEGRVDQSSLFTPFQWTDALLMGNVARALHVLNGLQQEDTPIVVLLRIVQKELFTLFELAQPLRQYQITDSIQIGNLKPLFDHLKIWQNRRIAYTNALKRFRYLQLHQLLQELALIEKHTKQNVEFNPWQALQHFSILFCQK